MTETAPHGKWVTTMSPAEYVQRMAEASRLDEDRLGQAIEEHIRRRLSFHDGPGCEYDCRKSIAAEYDRLRRIDLDSSV